MTANEPIRIACVGASVTFGLGLPNRREACYPAVLQRLLDEHAGQGAYRVRNFGYSGATISRAANEPYWQTPSFTAATRFEPQAVLVMLGTNDAQFANADARETLAADLTDLVEHFQGLGAKVFLSDPPPAFPSDDPVFGGRIDFEALTRVVRPTIRRVATELGLPLVDFLTPLADRQADFPDGLHPTAPIAAELAQIAFSTVEPRL